MEPCTFKKLLLSFSFGSFVVCTFTGYIHVQGFLYLRKTFDIAVLRLPLKHHEINMVREDDIN